jgi:thioredoxin reductase (NADPH)
MAEIISPVKPIPPSRADQVFPVLTAAQIDRIAPHGHVRVIEQGEVLTEPGQSAVPFIVIRRGAMEVVQPSGETEIPVTKLGPGQFTGEISTLFGRNTLVRTRASETSEVIQMDREQMLGLVQTDSELSEILMRAFILRRVSLIAQGLGGVVVLGSSHNPGTLRLKEFLTRNGHPYQYIDLDRDTEAQELLDRFHVLPTDVPVLICRDDRVLRNPSYQQIAECLGFNMEIDETQVHDLVIVGAGPSGLAAAVYAASEGLDVLVIESHAPGGQAGSSSRIENYLGFPTGISGQALMARASVQAQKFGTRMVIAQGAQKLACAKRPYIIETDGGLRLPARTIIIATGAEYRKPSLEDLARFEGAGMYYGATFMEAQLCAQEEIVIIGGGNSAGQAAVFLAQTAKRVHILVRSAGLAESMSRYLIRRIEENTDIVLHPYTEIVAVEGGDHLEKVTWRNNQTGATDTHDIRHIFAMTGAVPGTHWLDGCLALDAKGFVKTGPDLTQEDLAATHWPLERAPYLLETGLPGVFAVGDVRAGNVKRVASAVGEGSIAVAFVHQVLRE